MSLTINNCRFRVPKEEYDHYDFALSCVSYDVLNATDSVFPFVRRLLDDKYRINREFSVITGKKKLAQRGSRLPRLIRDNTRTELWRKEADALFAQRNISDKALWLAGTHDRKE